MKRITSFLFLFLIPAIVLSLLSSFSAHAVYQTDLMTEKDMTGKIGVSAKGIELLTVGDSIQVDINPELVMPGDRLAIYEVIKSQQGFFQKLWNRNRLATSVGTIVITSIHRKQVYGKVETVKQEVFSGSYLMFELPEHIQHSRYFDFLKKIVSARLTDPVGGKIKVAIIDVTDRQGNVTRRTQTVFKELSEAVCGRPQFSCANRERLLRFINQYEIETSKAIGRYLRNKLGKHFDLDQLITAEADIQEAGVFIYITSWDLKKELKTPVVKIEASVDDYPSLKESPDKTLIHHREVKYGLLRITVEREAQVKNKKVDYLFMENMEDYLYPRYRGDLGKNLSENVRLGKLTVSLENRNYAADNGNTIFDDVVREKTHRVLVSVTPVLIGKNPLVVGRPIEKLVEIDVPSDEAIHTEIILKTYENKAIIIIDSNSMN